MRFVLVLVVLAGHASAQPSPAPTCEGCARARYNLDALAEIHPEEAALLRDSAPQLVPLGDIGIVAERITANEEEQLYSLLEDNVRAALTHYAQLYVLADYARLACNADDGPCVTKLLAALECATSDTCVADGELEPEPDPRPQGCEPYMRKIGGSDWGFGGDIGSGWQDSAVPNMHRAWTIGFEARRRITPRIGAIARFDRWAGRDEGVDTDDDGRDDVGTGDVTHVALMAGPSFILQGGYRSGLWRFLELDVLAGYSWMTSPGDEDGFAAGLDLSYQLGGVRLGMRAVQGLSSEAQNAQALLGHMGLSLGATPPEYYSGSCNVGVKQEEDPRSHIAFGFDVPISGYGLGTGIGYSPPFGGFGIEAAWSVHPNFMPLVRGDLLMFLNGDADHVLHHSLMAGGRIDLSPREASYSYSRSGPFVALLAGYGWAAVTRPSNAGSGPVADASIGWLLQEDDGMFFARLHGRLGLASENADLRALFLSVGVELRVDKRTWQWD